MTPERHQRAMDVFNAALELAPASRPHFVRDACGSDPMLIDEVSSLLAWDHGTLTHDTASPDSSFDQRCAPLEIPEQIGPYEIAGLLGVGGMAVVYRARQKHPDRVVALKVLRSNQGESAAVLRFKREISLLACLQHPGIAQIYDAGTATIGNREIPYFAMELIEGRPLTAYVDERAVSTRGRLQLLIRICEAVEYAHQRGIIHRDIKPANILVEPDNDAGRPRVLDFGIARLLESPERTSAFVTREHRVLGTLAYMSPEQLDADWVVDTRCDVYALGAVGYELLCGRPPLDLSALSQMSAIRRIQSQTPPSLGSIEPLCRGDLSLILDRALAKDPATRYQSAAAFADDLRAFLDHRPIRARAPGPWYVIRKFAQRNPLAVSMSVLTLLVVILGASGTGWGLLSTRRANNELRNQLNETTDSVRFLIREVVAGLDSAAGTADIRRALLERLLSQIEDLRRRSPHDVGLREDHASVLTFYSDALAMTARLDEALALRRQALALYRELAAIEPESTARRAQLSIALVKTGDMHRGRNELALARSYYEQAYAIDQQLIAAEPDSIAFLDNLAWSHDRLGHLAMSLRDIDGAARHFNDRLTITNRLLTIAPDRHATRHGVIMVNGYLAAIARLRGDQSLAESHLRCAADCAKRLAADLPNHRLYREVLCNAARDLGDSLATSERPREAVGFFDQAVRAAAHLHEGDPNDIYPLNLYFGALTRRAALAMKLGDLSGAERVLQIATELADSETAVLVEHVRRDYLNQIADLTRDLEGARARERRDTRE